MYTYTGMYIRIYLNISTYIIYICTITVLCAESIRYKLNAWYTITVFFIDCVVSEKTSLQYLFHMTLLLRQALCFTETFLCQQMVGQWVLESTSHKPWKNVESFNRTKEQAILPGFAIIPWNNPKKLEKPCITKGLATWKFLGLILSCNKVLIVDPGIERLFHSKTRLLPELFPSSTAHWHQLACSPLTSSQWDTSPWLLNG